MNAINQFSCQYSRLWSSSHGKRKIIPGHPLIEISGYYNGIKNGFLFSGRHFHLLIVALHHFEVSLRM